VIECLSDIWYVLIPNDFHLVTSIMTIVLTRYTVRKTPL
jgi:hypothetical protein